MKTLTTFLLFISASVLLTIGSQTVVNLTTPGAGMWEVPTGVTQIVVEAWGGGGNGVGFGGGSSTGVGGGGGGGAYVRCTLNVNPGEMIPYFVGAASESSTWNINVINANAGQNATGSTGGNGGSFSSTCMSPEGFVGGAGANGSGTNGGGGGSSAGINSSGGNAMGSSGGMAPMGGGNGGAGRTGSSGAGGDGSIPGGGGGGALKTSSGMARSGGMGARGEIKITYDTPPDVDPPTGTCFDPESQIMMGCGTCKTYELEDYLEEDNGDVTEYGGWVFCGMLGNGAMCGAMGQTSCIYAQGSYMENGNVVSFCTFIAQNDNAGPPIEFKYQIPRNIISLQFIGCVATGMPGGLNLCLVDLYDPCEVLNVEVPLMPIIINKSNGMIIGQTGMIWGDGGISCEEGFLNLAKFVCPKEGMFTLLVDEGVDVVLDPACLDLSLPAGTYTIDFCTTHECEVQFLQRGQINTRDNHENGFACCLQFDIVLWDFSITDPCSCDDPLNIQLPGQPVSLFHDRLVLKATEVDGLIEISGVCITSVLNGPIFDENEVEIDPANGNIDFVYDGDTECWYLDFWRELGVDASVEFDIKFEDNDAGSVDNISGTFDIEPCLEVCPIIPIPAMGTWALIILGMMMTIFSIAYIRKRKPGMV